MWCGAPKGDCWVNVHLQTLLQTAVSRRAFIMNLVRHAFNPLGPGEHEVVEDKCGNNHADKHTENMFQNAANM